MESRSEMQFFLASLRKNNSKTALIIDENHRTHINMEKYNINQIILKLAL